MRRSRTPVARSAAPATASSASLLPVAGRLALSVPPDVVSVVCREVVDELIEEPVDGLLEYALELELLK